MKYIVSKQCFFFVLQGILSIASNENSTKNGLRERKGRYWFIILESPVSKCLQVRLHPAWSSVICFHLLVWLYFQIDSLKALLKWATSSSGIMLYQLNNLTGKENFLSNHSSKYPRAESHWPGLAHVLLSLTERRCESHLNYVIIMIAEIDCVLTMCQIMSLSRRIWCVTLSNLTFLSQKRTHNLCPLYYFTKFSWQSYWNRFHIHPHCMDEETEAQAG